MWKFIGLKSRSLTSDRRVAVRAQFFWRQALKARHPGWFLGENSFWLQFLSAFATVSLPVSFELHPCLLLEQVKLNFICLHNGSQAV